MSGPEGVPPVVQEWVRQLLDPAFLRLFEAAEGQGGSPLQIDVRLVAAGGKVRSKPALVVNGGQQAMVAPGEMHTALRSTG